MEITNVDSLPVDLQTSSQNIKISPNSFYSENIKRIPDMLRQPRHFVPGLVLAVAGLGSIPLLNNPDYNAQVAGALLTLFAANGPLFSIRSAFKEIEENIPVRELYPDIIENMSESKLGQMLQDGFRGYYSAYTNETVASVLDYKTKLTRIFARKAETQDQARFLYDLVFKIPDPQLKLELIKAIEFNNKEELSDLILLNLKSDEKVGLEKLVCHHLAKSWKLPVDFQERQVTQKSFDLENLKTKNIIKEADKISKEIVKNIDSNFPKTLIPFVRLYVLRRVSEELSSNNLIDFDGQDFSVDLVNELSKNLNKSGSLEKESSYDPYSVTMGLEMQPDVLGVTPLKTNLKDIKSIIGYVGMEKSADTPFEFVFPPTKTVEAQLLFLQEILILTGVPIDRAGIQINFGGLGKEETILGLQRIILSAGRLDPTWDWVARKGAGWDMGKLGGPNKGEVNIRRMNTFDNQGAKAITPPDEGHPEFTNVSEARAGVSGTNFFVFARGLIEARRLANLAKASEKEKTKVEIYGIEKVLADKYTRLINSYNEILEKHQMPEINKSWSEEKWKKFAVLTNDKKISTRFKRILSEALS